MIFFVLSAELCGQPGSVNIQGKVSFVSFQNIYVKFKSTDGILAGDTLFIQSGSGLIPSLIVKNLSSSSCLCSQLSSANLPSGATLIARTKKVNKNVGNEIVANKIAATQAPLFKSGYSTDSTVIKNKTKVLKQRIRGSTYLNSYSDNSNTGVPSSLQFRYIFNMDASNIADSKISLETYFSVKYKTGEWEQVKNDIFSALKIYSMAVRYEPNKTTRISLGRRINPEISSIGASDGLQFEKSFGRLSFGALAGLRPDYTDYGFNSKLLQYGGYLAYNTASAGSYSESSLAFMQQLNNSKTDRRFIYFQHSNSIIKNLSFFTTLEVDLYELDSLNNQQPKSTFNPTSLYLSLNYRLGKSLSFSGSYDARKNVIYYETYKSFIDRILENELRQGFRFSANYRITRDITFGLQSGYRFLKSDPRPSKNVYGYLIYNQIPGLKITATLNATYIESVFMSGNIYGLDLSRDLFNGKLQTGIGYKYVDYKLPENQPGTPQNIADINLYWQFARTMSFSLNYEGTFENQNKYNRVYLQLRKRF
jgi:hypothetical protein